MIKKKAKKHSSSQKMNAKRKNDNIICPKREDTFFFNENVFSLRERLKKHFLVSCFEGKSRKKSKMCQFVPSFCLMKENQKRNWRRETKK